MIYCTVHMDIAQRVQVHVVHSSYKYLVHTLYNYYQHSESNFMKTTPVKINLTVLLSFSEL